MSQIGDKNVMTEQKERGSAASSFFLLRHHAYFFFAGGDSVNTLSALISPLKLNDFSPFTALVSMVSSIVGLYPLCFCTSIVKEGCPFTFCTACGTYHESDILEVQFFGVSVRPPHMARSGRSLLSSVGGPRLSMAQGVLRPPRMPSE